MSIFGESPSYSLSISITDRVEDTSWRMMRSSSRSGRNIPPENSLRERYNELARVDYAIAVHCR